MARKNSISTSTLDFDNIKGNLRDFLTLQTEFSDFNFEGSAMSALLDVLAYNTQQNALLANFALNESFLTTSQLRSSMVNHSLNFGYSPRSKSGAKAVVSLSINLTGVSPKPTSVTLPQYSRFSATLDDISYTYYTLDEYIGYDRTGSGVYTFEEDNGNKAIAIVEGVRKTKTFRCNDALERQIYVIPDQNLDSTTLSVKVFDTISSDDFVIYEQVGRVTNLSAASRIYLPFETYNGFYEINFGDGQNTGVAPTPGNIIQIEYLVNILN